MIVPDERRHLVNGPRPGEEPGGAGTTTVVARGGLAPGTVLDRSREVLLAVLEYSERDWPTLSEWGSVLPAWFVSACAQQRSLQEAERWLAWWRTLSPEEQARAESEQPWSLEDWLYWLFPPERQWFWWDAVVRPEVSLQVTVEVAGWPTALGSLQWLLRAAGADQVIQGHVEV